jgi:hypothetical protein
MKTYHLLRSIYGVGAAKAIAHNEQGGAVPIVVTQVGTEVTAIQGSMIKDAQHAVQQAKPAIGPVTLCWICIDIKNRHSAMVKKFFIVDIEYLLLDGEFESNNYAV